MREYLFDNVSFAEELREIRRRKGISATKMACELGTSTSQVHRIETGENITVYALARYLNVIGLDILDVFTE